jgi:O-antigen ligase
MPGPLNRPKADLSARLLSAADFTSDAAGGRFFMSVAALRIALDSPFLGAGGGNFTQAYLEKQGEMLGEPAYAHEPMRLTHDAHNDWLQLAAESGFPALLLFAALCAGLFAAARGRGAPDGAALAAALAAFATVALFSFPLAVPPCGAPAIRTCAKLEICFLLLPMCRIMRCNGSKVVE